MLLSLFCGAGGLDNGFERAGFEVGLAFDIRPDSIESYNCNRPGSARGHCQNIRDVTLQTLDQFSKDRFQPSGIIGGPPCQSFSRANKSQNNDDPRHDLPFVYADLIRALNRRAPVPFFVFENVVGLTEEPHREKFISLKRRLSRIGFSVRETILNAANYGVPQNRERVIMVGFNRQLYPGLTWQPPVPSLTKLTVRDAIGALPEPMYFRRDLTVEGIPHHPNHWCMQPKSAKFTQPGALAEGRRSHRSFKALTWNEPSITVAYGHREVHIHPNCRRRLSVFEAMLLQGFPAEYILRGNLSSQITQVSEAVPPPLAYAVAMSIQEQLGALDVLGQGLEEMAA